MNKPVYYKDLLAGHRAYSEKELGRKGLSLALLVANNVPVPPFFIMQPDLFTSVISTIFQDTDITSLEVFKRKVLQAPLAPQAMQMLEAGYHQLSGLGQAWVAVRSSVVAPLHPDSRFNGIMNSLLNVRGVQDLEDAVKQIYASLFENKAYDYLQKRKISYGDVQSAVIIQKMVQAEVSGIMYTYDPITLNKEHVSIEAVFGLGDVLADGSLNPDIYTCSKATLEIVEKKIVPQDWMKVRKLGESDAVEHLQRVPISKVWQYSQKLDDSLVRELTKLADNIEKALGGPQVIEWVMERGHIYVLQTKHLKTKEQNSKTTVKKPKHKVVSMSDIDSFSTIADDVPITVSKEAPPELREEKPVKLPTETLLFTGTGASSGVAYGEVIVVPHSTDLKSDTIEELKTIITKHHVLVTDEFISNLEPLFMLAGGVVTNFGGINSDAALNAREMQIPAIVGTRIATSFLQNGFLVKIDGSSGGVYGVDFLPEKPIKQPHNTFKPDEIKELKKKPASVTPPQETLSPKRKIQESPVKVFLTNAPFGTSSYLTSIKDSRGTYEQSSALMVPVTTATKVEISRIKKLLKETEADLYILLANFSSPDSVYKTKRALAAHKIRRTKRVKFIIGLHSIYSLLNTASIADMAVDGVLYQVPSLTRAYAPDRKKLDEKFWQLIFDNIDSLKRTKLTFVGLELPTEFFTIPLKQEVKPLLKKGVGALVFTEQMDHATSDDVQDIEKEMMSIQLNTL